MNKICCSLTEWRLYMRKIHKIIAGCLIGTLTWFGGAAVAQGAEVPVAGINLLIYDVYQSNENAQNIITELLGSEEGPEYKGLSFAQVSRYVNIRSKPSEESKILGKLYNNSAATILEKEGDWYKVKSGTVEGYIMGSYLKTGQEADQLAKSLGTKIADVNTQTLRVREKANTDSSIITLVPNGEELQVNKELDDWLKITVEGKTGYVSADYVTVKTVYEEAVSIQEEQERIAQEEASTRNSSNNSSKKQSTYSNSNSSKTSSSSSSSKSSVRSKIVNYALKFQGNPYKWGGTSLTRGADCSGFTQSVFEDYGIYIPRTSRSQAASGRRVSLDNIQPGDLVFYSKRGTINHVAIYIGNGKVISASSPSTGIRVTSLYYRDPVKVVSYIK